MPVRILKPSQGATHKYDWDKLLPKENDDEYLRVYDDNEFSDEEVICFLEDAFDSDDKCFDESLKEKKNRERKVKRRRRLSYGRE